MPHSHRHRHPQRDFFGDINSIFDDAFGGGDKQEPKATKHEGRGEFRCSIKKDENENENGH